MAPTQDQYEVALGALREDADTWELCAADLEAAKATAESLDLAALHFSYVADKLGITSIYGDFQRKLARLLDEGRVMSTGVAAALRASARTYQEEEDAGVHRMNNVW
jgi:hypothetical protein